MGIFVIPIRIERLVRFMDCMAIQAIVPMKVAISADNTARRQCIPQSLHDLFVLEQGSIPFGRKTSPFCTGLTGVEGGVRSG